MSSYDDKGQRITTEEINENQEMMMAK